MKIAILVSQPASTTAPFFRRLSKTGLKVVVYFYSDFGIEKEDFDPQFNRKVSWGTSAVLEGYNYKILKNFLPLSVSARWGFWLNFGIVWELIRNKYDGVIIYGWNSPTNWLAFITALFIKMPIILNSESAYNQELTKSGFRQKFKKIILGWLFRRTGAFLYIGVENKKFYQSYDVPERKLFFTPYATDNDFFMAQRRRREGGDNVILFVGKLIEKKRPLDLLKAYELLVTNYGLQITSHLIYVGSGELEKELKEYAKEHHLKNVHFAGFKNPAELPDYFNAAHVFVLPSGRGETWGIVVNQALCFGLPVIVSDMVGCGKDLARQNENGFIFPVGDAKKLADYLAILAENPKVRLAFGEKSLQIISEYSYEKVVQGISEALKHLYPND